MNSNTTTQKGRTMIAHVPNLNEIFARHEIAPRFREEFRSLVEQAARPSYELLTCLKHAFNYKAALQEVLAELSKGLDHKFPPPDYRAPADYPLYESLSPQDTVLATSAGCAV